ncbi:MAG TPA: 16S rRNA (cytidine(1402)-2'-O)-methyltransferase, partial [Acidimicrobiia bacterium]|nr:16S rRNA (cytidine(1402)-2'-O)-methyltransferase [Acidimicrobiia bacterium]
MTKPSGGPRGGGVVDGGRLVLVATPIGNLGDLSARGIETLRTADVIACEDTRRTRVLLSAAEIPGGGRLRAVHEHNEAAAAARIAREVADGRVVAYVSDAGMPGISDPGARLVRACIELDADLAVTTVPGPTALAAALVLSGLPADRFVFEGFLPRRGSQRRARLAAIGAEPRTVVLYESPRRLAATLGSLVGVCGPDRPAAVARELTKLHEEVLRAPLGACEIFASAALPPPRGEHVIVVGGAPAADEATDGEIEVAVVA